MKTNKPLVSIVTPSFNQGRFIEDTILSVKNQDYPNIEHIIVDGGSTDNTLDILKRYEKEYNLRWISEPDEGQSDAVNKGFRMAKGEIIGWLNSDDVYFTRDVISYVVEKFRTFHEVDVIYGNTVIIDEEGLILKVRHTIPWFSFARLLRINFISQPSTFFKENVIQDYKLDMKIDLPMDYEYWLRIAKDGLKFKYVSKILSAERWQTRAKTISRWEEMKAETRKVQERYGQKFGFQYHLFRITDFTLRFMLLEPYAIKTIIRLFANFEKQNFAFSAKFDSLLKTLLRQFIYSPNLISFPFVKLLLRLSGM